MTFRNNRYAQWSLVFIAVGILIRLINLNMPLLEGALTRQVQTASIARNLLENGFDFLHPQINVLPEPRYYILEAPLYNSIVALLYKVFGVHESLGRLVSILAFAVAAIYLYRIASRNLNDSVARAAVFVLSFSPLSLIFTHAFQPDTLALMFMTCLMFYAVEWIKGDEKAFAWACGFGALTFFTKQTFMFVLLPLFLFGLHCRGKNVLRNWKVYVFLILTISPSLFWVYHASQVSHFFPDLVVSGNFELSNWFTFSVFFNYAFYKNIFSWVSGLILTPVGFTMFLLGLWIKTEKSGDVFLNCWLIGMLVFNLLLPLHAYTHEYYHLPLLLPASMVIGKTWWFLFENQDSPGKKIFEKTSFKALGLLVVAVMIFGYSNSGYKLPASVKHFHEQTESLNKYTQDEDLIIVTARHHLYYGKNKGWKLIYDPSFLQNMLQVWDKSGKLEPTPVNLLESLRKAGASYFFITHLEEFYRHKEFADYMFEHYPVLENLEGVSILFKLKA